MNWFTLSLLCAITLATADVLTKKQLTGYSGMQLVLVRLVVPGVLLAPLLFIYPLPATPFAFWGWVMLLVPLELFAMLLYMQAIRDAPFYQTLPYLSFTPVFNILTGWLLLDEQVSLLGASGIVLVVLGAYLLNIDQLRQNGKLHWIEPLRATLHQQGARRMLVVAIIYSFTSVIGKAAMQYVGELNFAAFYFALLGVTTLLLVALRKPAELNVLMRNSRWHLIIGALMVVMVITHFLAIAKIEAAYMIAVKRLSLLFGILFGAWLLNEKGLTKNLSATSFMVAGVALILLA
jgi:drug/metabolite transporter (DMT)-like permease